MARVISIILSSLAISLAQVDPSASCPDATPSSASCCYTNHTVAVMGGIDFVDLSSKTQGKDSPAFGNASYAATLSG